MKKIIHHLEEYISVAGLVIMTLITFTNVLSRQFLKVSWSFTEEITTNTFILITMLGTAMAARQYGHLGLSILYDVVPKKLRKVFTIVAMISILVLCLSLIIFGFKVVAQEFRTGQTTPALGWPEWIFGLFMPLGGVLILIRFMQAYVKLLKEEAV